jgi:hypothetical protein
MSSTAKAVLKRSMEDVSERDIGERMNGKGRAEFFKKTITNRKYPDTKL